MLRLGSTLARMFVLFVGVGLVTLHGTVEGQVDAHGERNHGSRSVEANRTIDKVAATDSAATVFFGRVLGPDGAPAVGAVIVTSAGGQTVTDADGSFSLDVELPEGAETVSVTAVMSSGTRSLVASVQVARLARWGTTAAGTLILEQAATCQPSWLPTFGGLLGVGGDLNALTVFDDGSGPALYAGGEFTAAGGVAANYIAKWNGSNWSALGSGMSSGSSISVNALTVFDDGSGPALYAGGLFSTAGDVAANSIAKWNGSSWSALGSGMNDSVFALTVFDDGSGPALCAGGDFITAGGVAANRIAKWNGSNWSALGSGLSNSVLTLTAFDDGSGPALYAGGVFTTADGVAANRIARWNGSSWSALGSGMNDAVNALAVFDDGSGPALYAGGTFTTAGDVTAKRAAKWNGSIWSALGNGLSNSVFALTVFDDGSGQALYAGGVFKTASGPSAKRIAKWNGSGWSALGSGLNDGVGALTVFDDGSGQALYAGGVFTTAGGVPANRIARWDGSSWSSLGSGLNRYVYALAAFDDGSGPALYAGGFFTIAGDVAANRIAKWNGSSWSALGSGMSSIPSSNLTAVYALTVFDDGSGPALYAGGDFTIAGGMTVNHIAKWNGSSWSALGSGMSGVSYPSVSALTVFDDGGGPALYAGGTFATAGDVTAKRIAKWNGSSWSALGSGMGGVSYPSVSALTVFDDGGGPALYAGGYFTAAGDVAANLIAKWNGSSWSALGSGMNGAVETITVFDDGSGPALYAGGCFTTAGGVAAKSIAKWNGSSWSALGSGMNNWVSALTVFDDGSGPALYAGGEFTAAGGVAANYIAKWNGASWSALGSGMGGLFPYVYAITVFDDGSRPTLFAGGAFSSALDSLDGYLAKWGGCPVPPPPPLWIDLGFALPGSAGVPQLVGTGALFAGTPLALALTNAAPSAPTVLCLSLTSAPLSFKGGTLVPVPALFALPLTTDAAGDIFIPYPGWPPGASGLSLYFQDIVLDAGAIQGVALSNALRADVP